MNEAFQSKTFDVFLSHSRADQLWVSRLKKELESQGISVWLDAHEIRPGDSIPEAVSKGIEASRSVVLVVSRNSEDSQWYQLESNLAVHDENDGNARFKTRLIPIKKDNVPIPRLVRNRLFVDFTDKKSYRTSLKLLVWGIKGEKPDGLDEVNEPYTDDTGSPADFEDDTELIAQNADLDASKIRASHDPFETLPEESSVNPEMEESGGIRTTRKNIEVSGPKDRKDKYLAARNFVLGVVGIVTCLLWFQECGEEVPPFPIQLIEIQPGEFEMGSNSGEPHESPVRTVHISQRFWMGETEVTQEQWDWVMIGNDNPSQFGPSPKLPVENVSWEQAQEFIERLNVKFSSIRKTKDFKHLPAAYEFRLPTEAEWEFACRAGTQGPYFCEASELGGYA